MSASLKLVRRVAGRAAGRVEVASVLTRCFPTLYLMSFLLSQPEQAQWSEQEDAIPLGGQI